MFTVKIKFIPNETFSKIMGQEYLFAVLCAELTNRGRGTPMEKDIERIIGEICPDVATQGEKSITLEYEVKSILDVNVILEVITKVVAADWFYHIYDNDCGFWSNHRFDHAEDTQLTIENNLQFEYNPLPEEQLKELYFADIYPCTTFYGKSINIMYRLGTFMRSR